MVLRLLLHVPVQQLVPATNSGSATLRFPNPGTV